MGKEIVNQVQEVQRVPYRINPRRKTPRHILIKLTKIKYKEKILNAARENQQITYKGIPIKVISLFFSRNSAGQKGVAGHISSDEREKPTTKITLLSEDHIQIRWRNQKLYRQAKAKRIQHHQTSFTANAKGTSLGGKHKKGKDPQEQTQNN